MGSVVAILSRSGPPEPAAARRMLSAAPHRGSHFEVRDCGNAILGVSNTEDLINATISAPGAITAVCAGTLDNRGDLIDILKAAGHRPTTSNAADVVVAAFAAFGLDAPQRFRGVFAGVVTDGQNLWSFRDHLGLHPLFYCENNQGFFAATEVKQVIAGAGISREPDLEALERIFYGRMGQMTRTAFKGVHRVPHSTTVAANGTGASTAHRYWHPRSLVESARFRSIGEVQEQFDSIFETAVARCLTGKDVISLSGGVDSPAVAGFAAPLSRRTTDRSVAALSMVFPDHPKVDERPYIEAVTAFLEIPLNAFHQKAKLFDDVVNWCERLDGPVPSMSPPQMHEFYLEARRLGFRNILTGDIAEFVVDMPRHLAGHLLLRGRWRSLARLLRSQHRRGASLRKASGWKKLASQLFDPFVPGRLANWYLALTGRDFPQRVPDWMDRKVVSEIPYRNDLLTPGPVRWLRAQTSPLEGCPITLEGAEVCAAVSGVTVRRPFADIDLWEFFLSLPAEIKYPDGRSKTLLRQLLRGKVPDQILDRRDKTFFDDDVMSRVDYTVLRRFLTNPTYRIRGIDYDRLAVRLDREDLRLIDVVWANDALRIHAFLSQW